MRKDLTVLISGIYLPAQTLATQAVPSVAASQPELSLTTSLLKTAGMLGFIIALIYGLAWLLRKSQKKLGSNKQHLSLVETLPLGRNERLCLIKSGDHYLVLGVSPQGVNRIDEIPSETFPQTDTEHAPVNSSWQWAQQILHRH